MTTATPAPLAQILEAARIVALAGGRSTLAYWRNDPAVDTKSDGTPVTIADREAESVMRQVIGDRFPSHGIVGEEHDDVVGDGRVKWILDPIDGTKTFVAGVPLYGTLVGVEIDGEPAVGVIYLPALGEMVSAATGLGCWDNHGRCSVTTTTRLADALICCTDEAHARSRDEGWNRLQSRARLTRGWGDCYGYALVATGRADAMVDPEMAPWDCAPMVPIIEEAGGRFTAWNGDRTIYGKDSVATNGLLHADVLDALGEV